MKGNKVVTSLLLKSVETGIEKKMSPAVFLLQHSFFSPEIFTEPLPRTERKGTFNIGVALHL